MPSKLAIVDDDGYLEPDVKVRELSLPSRLSAQALRETFGSPIFVGEVTKEALGLDNVDNTRDLDKPVSTATQAAIANALTIIDGGNP
jgi:hypothetical protein